MATIKVTVRFLDYWHLSSGLSGGAQLDSSVVKDRDNLPYIPAKTLKGLSREMAMILKDCSFVNRCFGGSSDEKDDCYDKEAKNRQGDCTFLNLEIPSEIATEITKNHLSSNLYDVIAATKIDENGVAQDNSLREIEVVVPLTLEGSIENVAPQDVEQMQKVLKMITRMGLNRNRGLGRCEIKTEVAQ